MRRFEYTSAGTVDEAVGLLGATPDGSVRALAGGTDLLTLMKADLVAPEKLVDIKRAAGLNGAIEEGADGLTLGALATLSEIETDPAIAQRYPALAEAAAAAATPQLRNIATLGGNLLQRPRCWYFRSPHVRCWLNGGSDCPARDGENRLHALFEDGPCRAVHPSDLAPALLALDAEARLGGRAGERMLPLAELFAAPEASRRTETTLGRDALLLSIRLPSESARLQSTYLKAMDRKAWAFALVSVAAAARLDGRRIEAARIVLGGVATTPRRATAAERVLVGGEAGDELFARAAEAALEDARPLRDNAYKLPLAKALMRRALASLTAGEP